MKFRLSPLSQCLNATLVLTLAACGGGGGGETPTPDGGTPPPSATVTLTGSVMVNQAIRNVTVCLDLNANNACDAGEPASAKTGADGIYSLTYDPAQVPAAQVAAASLIAPMVPGALTGANTTIDAGDPTPYSKSDECDLILNGYVAFLEEFIPQVAATVNSPRSAPPLEEVIRMLEGPPAGVSLHGDVLVIK